MKWLYGKVVWKSGVKKWHKRSHFKGLMVYGKVKGLVEVFKKC